MKYTDVILTTTYFLSSPDLSYYDYGMQALYDYGMQARYDYGMQARYDYGMQARYDTLPYTKFFIVRMSILHIYVTRSC